MLPSQCLRYISPLDCGTSRALFGACGANSDSPGLPDRDGQLRLRQHVPNSGDPAVDQRRDLWSLPSVFHREAASRRYRRTRRAVSTPICNDARSERGVTLQARLEAALARAVEVQHELATPEVTSDPAKLRELGREHARLDAIRQVATRLTKLQDELKQAHELASDPDPELVELARDDVDRLTPKVDALDRELGGLLIPHDPLDDRDTIVEIRAGTGGDEAALFVADLLRMYQRFAERQGWTVETVSLSEGKVGGVKDVVFKIRGESTFGRLRHESGVHRVQRVPATETQGRIHTSAATVAILPEAEEVDVKIEEQELKIDVFRSSGPGGQSVNTTDSAVRITHVPTGLVVQCQDQKSQLQNKIKAMEVLRARLLDRVLAEQEAKRSQQRRAMVGTGDRSAKIRTYNFPQNRVTDHRINLTLHRLDSVLEGDLDEIIDKLREAYMEERHDA